MDTGDVLFVTESSSYQQDRAPLRAESRGGLSIVFAAMGREMKMAEPGCIAWVRDWEARYGLYVTCFNDTTAVWHVRKV